MLQVQQGIAQAGSRLMSWDQNKRHPEHNGRLALVAGWQCVADHSKDMPRVLQAAWHLPYGRVSGPVIQYIHIYECDWEKGRPVVDARDSIPVDRDLVVHDCRESLQEHGQQKLRELAPLTLVNLDASVGFL